MSFIYKHFCNQDATPAEKENGEAVKAMLKERKNAIKGECKQYEADYKQGLKDAEVEYERKKQQLKQNMYSNIVRTVQTELDAIEATDAYINSDAKTKAKVAGFRSWMTTASTSCGSSEPLPSYPEPQSSYPNEKNPEMIAV